MSSRPASGLVCAFLILALGTPAAAQELSLLAGTTAALGSDDESYSWTLEYLHRLHDHAAISLSWLNEGHLPGHHRDGHCVQVWAGTAVLDPRLWLSAGIGPYRYFDTVEAEQGAGYADDHGWGAVLSIGSSWYGDSGWLFHLRANRIVTQKAIDTTTLQLGLGYQLGEPADAHRESAREANSEITVLLGSTIVNSFESEQDLAMSIEFRHRLGRHVEWTVAWLDEGDSRLVRRDGVTTQLWLVRSFFLDRVALGAGAGVYVGVDKYRKNQPSEEGDEAVSLIITATASYRLGARWVTRASWNRIATDYSRDTDVILAGVGYRF
jgi:hypothetical protein